MQHLKPLALLSLLLVATQASAHGLWTEQRRGNIEVIYGHGAEDNAFKAQKISGAWAYDGSGKMIPVSVERLADHARLKPLKTPAVMAVA
ncbi:nickel ABC transporter substrate-binding protein, partial [Pseudomonas prosekii]